MRQTEAKLNLLSLAPDDTRRRGFTLIEILVVVAIMSVLAAISFPFYARFITQNSVSSTANGLVGSLQKAQMYAMSGKNNSSWGVRYADSKIILFQESSNTVFDSYNVPGSLQITGLNQVVFSRPTGLPTSFGTYVVSSNNQTKSVLLNLEGVASVSE